MMYEDSSSVGNVGSSGPFSPGLYSSSLTEPVIWPRTSSKMAAHGVGDRATFSVDMCETKTGQSYAVA